MPQYRKISPAVNAQQWFPGREVPGVVNDNNPESPVQHFCGCLMLGGPAQAHVHASDRGFASLKGFLIRPGDYVVTDEQGHRQVVGAEEFEREWAAV